MKQQTIRVGAYAIEFTLEHDELHATLFAMWGLTDSKVIPKDAWSFSEEAHVEMREFHVVLRDHLQVPWCHSCDEAFYLYGGVMRCAMCSTEQRVGE